MDSLWKARILPWIVGYALNPQAPPPFPQGTALRGRPPGQHPLPCGWKAASHLSTVLGIRFANPTLARRHQQQHSIYFRISSNSEPLSLWLRDEAEFLAAMWASIATVKEE